MAFTDASPASYAILYAMYALSSLHLSLRVQAQEFKLKALSAVWTSDAQHPGTKDVLQRTVAIILLALFEVGISCFQEFLSLIPTLRSLTIQSKMNGLHTSAMRKMPQ